MVVENVWSNVLKLKHLKYNYRYSIKYRTRLKRFESSIHPSIQRVIRYLVLGEERQAHVNWSMVILENAAPVTGTTLRTTGPVPADSRP